MVFFHLADCRARGAQNLLRTSLREFKCPVNIMQSSYVEHFFYIEYIIFCKYVLKLKNRKVNIENNYIQIVYNILQNIIVPNKKLAKDINTYSKNAIVISHMTSGITFIK